MARGITRQRLGPPDLALARRQHEAYARALGSLGIEVTVLDALEEFPDSAFIEDVAVIHGGVAILTRPAAPERRGEVEAARPALRSRMPVRDLGRSGPGFLEGGDVLFAGRELFVGIGERTDPAGAGRLRQRLLSGDPTLTVRYVPFRGRLHLKTGLTALGPELFVGDPGLTLEGPWEFGTVRWLPAEEGHAANVLVVNGAGLFDGSSRSARTFVTDAGLRPIPLDLSEFRKMDGGLTCLSLLW